MVKRIHNGHEAVQFLRYAAELIADSKDAGTFEAALRSYLALEAASRKYLNWAASEPVRGR